MKQIPFLIFLFLISCANNSDQIEGAWDRTSASVTGNFTNSQGHLWSTIFFKEDSVLIFEDQFFKGNQTKYKIEDDSIEFLMEENPKYHFSLNNGLLELEGYNTIRGCKFWESATYKRMEYEYVIEKILTQDSINHYQLSIGSWCRDDVANIERHLSSENSQITKNLYDSIGADYFPRELDFNSSDLNLKSNLKFSIEAQDYIIHHYSGHQLTILFQSNDTSFYMEYSLCEDRVIELY
ncbi:MAG: hypothetical protein GQ574_00310 [Crocinitomix sp.]|nr:hypothetical protein [Crocinitomix sp.]